MNRTLTELNRTLTERVAAVAQRIAAFDWMALETATTVDEVRSVVDQLAAAYTSDAAARELDSASTEAIDDTLAEKCACGCGKGLDPDGVSAYFIDDYHQDAWYRNNNPGQSLGGQNMPRGFTYPYFYNGDYCGMRWAPNLVTADPGPIEPIESEAERWALFPVQPSRFTPRWGTRDGRYVLRLDDGNRYVETFLDRHADVTPAAVERAWSELEQQLTDMDRVVDGRGAVVEGLISRYLRAPEISGPLLREVDWQHHCSVRDGRCLTRALYAPASYGPLARVTTAAVCVEFEFGSNDPATHATISHYRRMMQTVPSRATQDAITEALRVLVHEFDWRTL